MMKIAPFYLEFVVSVCRTHGVVRPDSLALWVMEPLAIRITDFGNPLCLNEQILHVVIVGNDRPIIHEIQHVDDL